MRQRESPPPRGSGDSGASQTPYWFRSGEAFSCQLAAFAITDMGRSGVRNTSNPIGVRPLLAREVATMYAQECLKRTAECARLAEATNDPGLREYLTKLALSWMQSTTTAERNERGPADGPQRRRLKTVHDLFC